MTQLQRAQLTKRRRHRVGRLRRTALSGLMVLSATSIAVIGSLAIPPPIAEATGPTPTVVNFSYTGSAQSWSVPQNVVGAITFTVIGGGGGNSESDTGGYGYGGSGGEVTGEINAAAGTAFNIYVGSGGASGTGASGSSSCPYYAYSPGGNGGTSSLPSGLGSGGGGGWSGNMIQSYSGNCWEQYDTGTGAGGGGALSAITSSSCSSGISISGVATPTCFVAGGGGGGGGEGIDNVPTGYNSSTGPPSPTTSCTTPETGPFNVLFEFNWFFECLGGNGGAAESSASGVETPGSNPIATWDANGTVSSGINSPYSAASGNLSYGNVPQGYGAGGGGGGGGYGPGYAGDDESAGVGSNVAGGGGGAGGGSYVDATNVSGSTVSSSGNGAGTNGSVQISYVQGVVPAITSGASTTFNTGALLPYSVDATGVPTPTLSTSGTLPSGVTFTDNGNGTGTLSGTPSASAGGLYSFTITATNSIGSTNQSFTLTVDQPAAITSGSSTSSLEGSALSFPMTASGYPVPTFSEQGSLPSGVTLSSSGLLSGTPSQSGSFGFTVSANNGVGTTATQSFTLTVNATPAFSSSANTSFTAGSSASFTVSTTAYPIAALSVSGTLPTGVTFLDNGDGTSTFSGSPSVGGSYAVVISATNSVGFALQSFSLVIDAEANFTSPTTIDLAANSTVNYSVTTTGGYPTPTLSATGTLPTGISFADNGNGTATITGTATTTAEGTYPLTFVVAVTGLTPAQQAVSLVIEDPGATISCPTGDICGGFAPAVPTITSASTTTFTAGASSSFTFTATGSPSPSFSGTGALPSGITLTSGGILSGTPTQTGSFPFTVTAANGQSPDATQNFTLTVNAAPTSGGGGGSSGGGSPSSGGGGAPSTGTTPTTSTTTTTTLPAPTSPTPTTVPPAPAPTPTTLPPAPVSKSSTVSSYGVAATVAGGVGAPVSCTAPPSDVHESATKNGTLTGLGFSLSCTSGKNAATISGSIASTTKVVHQKDAHGSDRTTREVTWHGALHFVEPTQHLAMTFVPKQASISRDLVLSTTCVATTEVDHRKHQVTLELKISPHFLSDG